MKKLSDKPSEMILQALEDLEWIETKGRGKYRVNMDRWHLPVGKYCEVCFAGSVMARRYGCAVDMATEPFYFDEKSDSKFSALNYFREGNIEDAFEVLNMPIPFDLVDEAGDCINWVSDEIGPRFWPLDDLSINNREEWKLYMQDIAGILAAEGY